MIAKSTAVWVLCRGKLDHRHHYFGKKAALLVAEEGGSHTTYDDVDSHSDRDQKTRCDRAHSRKVSDGRGTTQDKHGRDDNVRGQPIKKEHIRWKLNSERLSLLKKAHPKKRKMM